MLNMSYVWAGTEFPLTMHVAEAFYLPKLNAKQIQTIRQELIDVSSISQSNQYRHHIQGTIDIYDDSGKRVFTGSPKLLKMAKVGGLVWLLANNPQEGPQTFEDYLDEVAADNYGYEPW